MSKQLGETSLIQLLTLVKNKIDTLLDKIEKKQQPFVVTATVDFANMVLTNLSCTFAEITEAYNRGDHIFLDLDISQMMPGQTLLISLISFHPELYAIFEAVVSLEQGQSAHVSAVLNAEGTSYVSVSNLANGAEIENTKQMLITCSASTEGAVSGGSGVISNLSHTYEEIKAAIQNNVPVVLLVPLPESTMQIKFRFPYAASLQDTMFLFAGIAADMATPYFFNVGIGPNQTSYEYILKKITTT